MSADNQSTHESLPGGKPGRLPCLPRRVTWIRIRWQAALALLASGLVTTCGYAQACTWNRGSGTAGDSNCTLTHDQQTRSFLAHIPSHFVPGQSGILIALAGNDVKGSAFCTLAGIESQGIARFVDSLPSPAPMVVCPQELKSKRPAGTLSPLWNSYEIDPASFVAAGNPVAPDDTDFFAQIVTSANLAVGLDMKHVGIFGLWSNGATMAARAVQERGDLFSSLTIEYTNWRGMFNTCHTNCDPLPTLSIPPSTFPVSVQLIELTGTSNHNICGWNGASAKDFTYNSDDEVNYWATADGITDFDVDGKICNGYDANGRGVWTGVLEKSGGGGLLNTVIQVWALKGGASKVYCSPNTGCSPVIHFITGACTANSPCNTSMTTSSGDTLDDLIVNFFLAHGKP